MFVSVDLPMPGEPPSSTSEPGTMPAAEHAVELADPGQQPRDRRRVDTSRQRHRPRGRAPPAPRAAAPRAAAPARALLDQRVPRVAARALAVPARRSSARSRSRRGSVVGRAMSGRPTLRAATRRQAARRDRLGDTFDTRGATWRRGTAARSGRATSRAAAARSPSATSAWTGNYSFKSRFEDGEGTNPEELLAAAHAGCFTMAMSLFLDDAGPPARDAQHDARRRTLRQVDGAPDDHEGRARGRGHGPGHRPGPVPAVRRAGQGAVRRLPRARRRAGDDGHRDARLPDGHDLRHAERGVRRLLRAVLDEADEQVLARRELLLDVVRRLRRDDLGQRRRRPGERRRAAPCRP